MKPIYTQLKLHDLALNLRLGWPDEERRCKQTVSVSIILKFPAMPMGCETDDLTGTICYDQLTKTITTQCEKKSYKLIEHLAYDIYNQVKASHPIDCQVSVSKQPPIENLHGGATFVCGDWETV